MCLARRYYELPQKASWLLLWLAEDLAGLDTVNSYIFRRINDTPQFLGRGMTLEENEMGVAGIGSII